MLVGLVAALLASCETVPVQPPAEIVELPARLPAETAPGDRRADGWTDPDFDPNGTADVRADPLQLAEDYLMRSRSASGIEAILMMLSAAELYMEAGRTGMATALMLELKSNESGEMMLYPAEKYRLDLLDATRRFRNGQYGTALRILDRLPANAGVRPDSVARMLKITAYAQVMEGDKAEAISTLSRRPAYLADPLAIIRNNNQVWAILGSIPDRTLALMRYSSQSLEANANLVSWIELAMLLRSHSLQGDELRLAITGWMQGNSLESVDLNWVATLLPPGWDGAKPSRVALLLPLNSRFADSAHVVQRGFITADDLNPSVSRPNIAVYATTGDPAGEVSAYQQAVADGADFIVGPLGRNAAESIVQSGVTMLPTLMLGTAERDTGPGIFQFDLDPDQEAVVAARHAFREGHRAVSILYPSSSWGERLANSFWQEWLKLGGNVASTLAYTSDQFDYSDEIQQLLGVNRSVDRFGELDRVLGEPTEFTPRRRQDVDVVFLVARPDQGRLLRPQLSFHQGHDLPIYATSHIYAGSPDPVNDTDLDGIRIGVMPVVLRSAGPDTSPDATSTVYDDLNNNQVRLFALGRDAYDLIPTLSESGFRRTRNLPGETGELALEQNGHILRNPRWVHFSEGVITPLPPSDIFPLQPDTDDELDSPDGITGRTDS